MPRKWLYDQFCPIAQSLDVVGDRWTLLIARELFVGPVRYGELLDALSPISTDVLAKRLREMAEAGLVQRSDRGYDLTTLGEELAPVLGALARWGAPRLAPPTSPEEVSASRALQILAIADRAPGEEDHSIELRAGGIAVTVTCGSTRLVIRRTAAEEPEAVVITDDTTLWGVGSGSISWREAIESGALKVVGDPDVAARILVERLLVGIPGR